MPMTGKCLRIDEDELRLIISNIVFFSTKRAKQSLDDRRSAKRLHGWGWLSKQYVGATF